MANKLTIAEITKTLVHFHYHGVISTIATDGGYPFGSVIDYLPLSQGDVVVLLHHRAEHFRYLNANSKASLLINASLSEHEVMDVARVTLLGEAQRLDADPTEELISEYLQRHPDAEEALSSGELVFFQLDVSAIRYIAGPNRAIWIEPADYRQAQADPLGEEAPWIIHELNHRRQSDLINIALNLANQHWVEQSQIVSVDRYGFDVISTGEGNRKATRLVLDSPALDRQQFETQFAKLSARARLMSEPL